MGCDYYLVTVLDVTTKDGVEHEFEYDRQKCYFFPLEDDDDDDETLDKEMARQYETKTVFSEGQWLIKNKHLIATYKDSIITIKQHQSTIIAWDHIQKIVKTKYAYERF